MIFDTDVLIWASRGSERAARAIDAAPDCALAEAVPELKNEAGKN
jgi:hypothetical protein